MTDFIFANKIMIYIANLKWLASKGILLTNHFAVTHPSEPNYVAAVGGDYYGMNNGDFNFINRVTKVNGVAIFSLASAPGMC